jgi:hypothetical protein
MLLRRPRRGSSYGHSSRGAKVAAPGVVTVERYNSQMEDRVARVVVGTAFILGALVLLYFSAFPVLRCERSAVGKVECRSEAYLLNYFKVRETTVASVGVVTLLPAGSGEGSHHLRFSSPSGLDDLGYFSQRFAGDGEILKQFVADRSRRAITLSKTVGGRALFAHVIGCIMFLLGVMVLFSLSSKPGDDPDFDRYVREQERLASGGRQ